MTHIEAMAGGALISIEVASEPGYGSEPTAWASRVAGQAETSMAQARETIISVGREMTAAVAGLAPEERPRELSVEFGVNFTGEGNVAVAKASAQATLKVTMVYDVSAGG